MPSRTLFEVTYEAPPAGSAPQRSVVARTAGFTDAVQSALFHMSTIGIHHLHSPKFAEAGAGTWVGPVAGAGEYRIVQITVPDTQ
jgi:hypothetical protein